MNLFDIAVCIIALVAIADGWRRGFVVQLCSIAAIVGGIWLAIHTGDEVGKWLGADERYAAAAGFLAVFAVVLIALALAGRVVKRIFDFVGLGLFDSLFGSVLSLLKAAIIVGMLCTAFDGLNGNGRFVPQRKIDDSMLFNPLCDATRAVLGFFDGKGKSLEKAVKKIEKIEIDV